jgi:hypothetical protein
LGRGWRKEDIGRGRKEGVGEGKWEGRGWGEKWREECKGEIGEDEYPSLDGQ